MTPENFCYWLQGLFEVGGAESLNSAQTQIVKDHLALVFTKVTPQYPYPVDLHPDSKRKEQNSEWNKYLPFVPTGTGGPFKGNSVNMYFGGESSLSIDPKTIMRTC